MFDFIMFIGMLCILIEMINIRHAKGNYWQELSAFLDRRDKIILEKFRDNKDHKLPKQ